ncbi:MAG: hydrophobe/amphiphile efflux-1 family RND transporter, partial [Sphingobacteriia bacterium 32-37-4]
MELEKIIKVDSSVENITTLSGYSLVTEAEGASFGMMMISLKPWDKRDKTVAQLIPIFKQRTSNIKDANIEFMPPPPVPGFGNTSGFELRVIDKTGSGDLQQTANVTNQLIQDIKAAGVVGAAYTGFDPSFPQYMIHIDYDMAAKKGVSVDNAMTDLQTLIGSYYATNFIRFGQMYKVMVQAYPNYRAKPNDLMNMYVKNDRGEMVSYGTFIKLERVYGPEQLTRYNMYTSAMVNGDAGAGFSSGEAIESVEKVAKEKLPRGYSYEWSGITRDQIESSGQAASIFLICLLFVYLILAAQYESFLMPFAVILSLPTGIFGAFVALKLLGLENNIYAQVALVMLIGLLGKN